MMAGDIDGAQKDFETVLKLNPQYFNVLRELGFIYMEKQEYEKEPIALILCASKESEEIELMGLDRGNIRVSEYWLNLPSKEVLEEKLHKAIENAKKYSPALDKEGTGGSCDDEV